MLKLGAKNKNFRALNASFRDVLNFVQWFEVEKLYFFNFF
jgi:hypothetical protein